MTDVDNLLVIDTGTSSMRAVLFNSNGKICSESSIEYKPDFHQDGWVEQNPEIWISSLSRVVRKVLADSSATESVAAIALTTARSSLIAVDGTGRPLLPAIMWQDRRCAALCHEFQTHYGHEIYNRTGLRVNTVVSAPKMVWLKKNNPSLYRKAAKLVGIHEYLLYYLTGEFVTDYSFGSRTLLMNLESCSWDSELLELFDLSIEKLCTLVPPGTVCGYLQSQVAGLLGLPEGIPVLTAGGDQQCAAAGRGAFEPGRVVVNTGTGAYLVRTLDKPVLDSGMGLFCNASVFSGQYVLEASILAAGSIYNWFCSLFNREEGEMKQLFRRIDNEIASSVPGSHGLLMIPSMAGKGSPVWDSNASGAFLNLTLGTSRGDMARAILEGLACELRENLELMRKISGLEKSICSSGGMSGFHAYNQMLADAFDENVLVWKGQQATALGAWVVAAGALKFYSSPGKAWNRAVQEKEKDNGESMAKF